MSVEHHLALCPTIKRTEIFPYKAGSVLVQPVCVRWRHSRDVFATWPRQRCAQAYVASSNPSAILVVSRGVHCTALTCFIVNCIKLMTTKPLRCSPHNPNTTNMRSDATPNGYSRRLLNNKRATDSAFVCL